MTMGMDNGGQTENGLTAVGDDPEVVSDSATTTTVSPFPNSGIDLPSMQTYFRTMAYVKEQKELEIREESVNEKKNSGLRKTLCGADMLDCCATDVTTCVGRASPTILDESMACTTACCPSGTCMKRADVVDLHASPADALPSRCLNNAECCESAEMICGDGAPPRIESANCATFCCASCVRKAGKTAEILREILQTTAVGSRQGVIQPASGVGG